MTVLEDVSADDSLMGREIFGPILAIVPVDSLQDAIGFVRDRHHPLCLYAFTDNEELKNRILQGTLSGNLTFNDTFQQLAVKELPCSGVGESEYGGVVLKYTFNEFSYERGSMDMPKECLSLCIFF
ncbi:Aldehyde/histidinol dehydrogenase [Mycena epipterygia]|nr:Aldehyde/histidinol dehydrogenase [Mycena epipterygia]